MMMIRNLSGHYNCSSKDVDAKIVMAVSQGLGLSPINRLKGKGVRGVNVRPSRMLI